MKKIFSLLPALLMALPLAAQTNHNFEVAKQLDIFNSLYRTLDLYYVDTLNAEKAVGDAILYMLDRLDPYTEYYTEEDSKDLRQLTTGKYAGIGSPIIYRKDHDRCIFSSPYEHMPAAEAGVRTGDVILAIDGKDLGPCGSKAPNDYTSEVSEALRGQPGTTFELKVKRPGVEEPLTLRLTRRTIELPSVSYVRMLGDSIGLVRVEGYTENTSRDLRRALVGLKEQGMKRLVLDLRGNGGGLMHEAVNAVNLFVPRGREVVRTKGKVQEDNNVYKTTAEPFDVTMPVVVLVDYHTASAAEITSGALQDYDRAVIVGRRTYGKGIVQSPRELPYNSMVKLTTSKYFIPSGRCVQAYDFKNRNADGMPSHLPDSLTKEFATAAGRLVRDGGGITPDVIVAADSLPGLISYLAASNEMLDFCIDYRNAHPQIAPAEDFRLTAEEYEAFKQHLRERKFTYDRASREALKVLKRVAAREGYAEAAKAEFDALEAKLTHDLDFDLTHWETQVRRLVESAIVESYYYAKGVSDYNLSEDTDLKAALDILRDDARYKAILDGSEKNGPKP